MTDRETLYSGLSNAAWGYFLLYVNFNLNFNGMSVNILPRFAGMLLLLSAIGKLKSERRDLALLRPLGVLLAVWYTADWVLALMGVSLDNQPFVFLDILVLVVTLYFHFQFLTDMAALAERYQPRGETLDWRIRRRRTAFILLVTAGSLLSDLISVLKTERLAELAVAVGVCLVALLLVFVILLMVSLFQLRRYVRDGEDGPETLE